MMRNDQLACTLEFVNRLAATNGMNGKTRAVKSVIHLLNGLTPQMSISNNKTIDSKRYLIQNISKIRKNFIQEGRLTIEMKEPSVNIMIRDSSLKQIEQFLKGIDSLMAQIKTGNGEKPKGIPEKKANSAEKSRSSNVESQVSEPLQKKAKLENNENNSNENRPVSLFFTEGRLGRMSKSDVMKTIKNNSTAVSCRNANDYPRSFSSSTQAILFDNIGLRKIDAKILKLQHLSRIEITKNKLISLDPLMELSCSLSILILNGNQIATIRDDLFEFKPLKNLHYLDLSNNELTRVPKSILKLPRLTTLLLSNNKMSLLPIQLQSLQALLKFKVDRNLLAFIPYSIVKLNLVEFDCSGNPFFKHDSSIMHPKFEENLQVPSLVTLASECLAEAARTMPGVQREIQSLPKILIELLNFCLPCHPCRKLTLRYGLLNHRFSHSDIAHSVTSNGLIPIQTPFCDMCRTANEEIYEPE